MDDTLQYVGFWSRFWASMVDIVLFLMILSPIFYMIYGDAFIEKSAEFTLVNNLLNYLLPSMAVLILWHYKSATPGKMLIGAKIVDASSFQKPTIKQFIVRNLAYLLSFLPFGLGYFWAGWDRRKQAWHDKLAHTVVVQAKKEKKRRRFSSYIAIFFGIVAIIVFTALLFLGYMIQSGKMSDGDLYHATRLTDDVKEALKENNVLFEDESIYYYQPHSIFSFTGSATLITDRSIRYFDTQADDVPIVWNFDYDEIDKLKIEVEPLALGIDILYITLYDKNSEIFSVGLSPKNSVSKKVKEAIIKLWQNAKKRS